MGDQKALAEPLAKIAPVEVRDLEGNPLALVPPGAPTGGTGGMVPGPGGGEGGKE